MRAPKRFKRPVTKRVRRGSLETMTGPGWRDEDDGIADDLDRRSPNEDLKRLMSAPPGAEDRAGKHLVHQDTLHFGTDFP